MRIVAIVQARMGSTRLPGKVLKTVNGKPLLSYQIERMKKSKFIDELVIATTPNGNEKIIELCQKLATQVFIGPEEDVLTRYYDAAIHYNADVVVRMTSDCPLIDPIIIDEVINFYLNNNFDYVSNTINRTFPRGMDTEVFSISALEKANKEACKDYEREHVTPYIYLNPNKFEIGQYTQKIDQSYIRLTVDTKEDFELICRLLKLLNSNDFELNDIIAILDKNPELLEINAHILQKKLGE